MENKSNKKEKNKKNWTHFQAKQQMVALKNSIMNQTFNFIVKKLVLLKNLNMQELKFQLLIKNMLQV